MKASGFLRFEFFIVLPMQSTSDWLFRFFNLVEVGVAGVFFPGLVMEAPDSYVNGAVVAATSSLPCHLLWRFVLQFGSNKS